MMTAAARADHRREAEGRLSRADRRSLPRQIPSKTRVVATPDMVKKYKSLGADVTVQAGAGGKASIGDGDFEAAGATIARSAAGRYPGRRHRAPGPPGPATASSTA